MNRSNEDIKLINALAIANAEIEKLRDRWRRLERWREEALTVLDQWDDVYAIVEHLTVLGECKSETVKRALLRAVSPVDTQGTLDPDAELPWLAPAAGAIGVFKCRGHFHVGVLCNAINWDDDPDFKEGSLYWEEMYPGQQFEGAASRWAVLRERSARL